MSGLLIPIYRYLNSPNILAKPIIEVYQEELMLMDGCNGLSSIFVKAVMVQEVEDIQSICHANLSKYRIFLESKRFFSK